MIYGVFGAAAFVLGSILAGYFTAKRGLKKTIMILCASFNVPFVMYALLSHFQPQNLYIITSAVVVEYFGYGFGFVGLILYIMQQISPGKYKMAHYAFADGIMALGFYATIYDKWLHEVIFWDTKHSFIWVFGGYNSFIFDYLFCHHLIIRKKR